MERDDVKRRRIMELAIVERVEQGLPLNDDAMNYLIEFFDLESLNKLCSTSWTMQQFCKENQVWRQKFRKHVKKLPKGLSVNQWLHYWDYLANGRCPNQYRLLTSFLFVLNDQSGFLDLINRGRDVMFRLDVPHGTQEAVEREYDASITIEPEIGFFVPTVLSCLVEQNDDNVWIDVVYDEEAIEVLETLDDLNWESFFNEETAEPMEITIPDNQPRDAVTVVYNFLGLGYRPVDFAFWNIKGQIGTCVQCERPKAKTVCGICEQVAYCGQECADKHWENHNCAATK